MVSASEGVGLSWYLNFCSFLPICDDNPSKALIELMVSGKSKIPSFLHSHSVEYQLSLKPITDHQALYKSQPGTQMTGHMKQGYLFLAACWVQTHTGETLVKGMEVTGLPAKMELFILMTKRTNKCCNLYLIQFLLVMSQLLGLFCMHFPSTGKA